MSDDEQQAWDYDAAVMQPAINYSKDNQYNEAIRVIPDQFAQHVDTRGRGGKPKSRKGMPQLAQIVGSKMARDIKRVGDLVSLKSAENYIARNKLKNVKARETDVDGDGIPEVVVTDKNGQVWSINGYTTKASDYPFRKLYYDQYQSRQERKEAREAGNTMKKFIYSRYQPTYGDDGLSITYKTNPKDDPIYEQAHKKGYNLAIPKERSPYQAFNQLIIKPVFDGIILSQGDKDAQKAFRKSLGTGALSAIASKLYEEYIVLPVFDQLNKMGELKDCLKDYIEIVKKKDPEFKYSEEENLAEFIEYVKNRKIMKENLKAWVIEWTKSDVREQSQNAVVNPVFQSITEILNGTFVKRNGENYSA